MFCFLLHFFITLLLELASGSVFSISDKPTDSWVKNANQCFLDHAFPVSPENLPQVVGTSAVWSSVFSDIVIQSIRREKGNN